MSLHALAFLGLFLLFAGLALRRSSWGIALYMLTFFAPPQRSGWGEGVLMAIGPRWNLAAALIFAAAVFLDPRTRSLEQEKLFRPVFVLLLLYAMDATVVHLIFADNPEYSWVGLQDLWKQVGLCFLLATAVRDKFDLKLLIYSMLLGAAYVGYEVVFNGAGHWPHDRLEDVPLASTASSNAVAMIFALLLPLGGWLFFFGKKTEKCAAVLSLVLILEVILRINSRGCFLGMIGGVTWLVMFAKGRLRAYAIAGIVLGILAGLAQMRGQTQAQVLGRFETTFAPPEERDPAAARRVDYWRQGLKMVRDHPFGSGYEAAFKSDLGLSYIRRLGCDEYRSVHNGYLDIAAAWGVQGLVLCLAAVGLAWLRLRAAISFAYTSGEMQSSFLGHCLEASLIVGLIASIFGGILKYEWYFWWVAMAVAYSHVVLAPSTAEEEAEERAAAPAYLPEPSCVALTRKSP